MEYIVKNRETLARIRESAEFRQMFRDVIKTQIQSLIDQLAYTGEESVLLSACISENDMSENGTVGSELGIEFLNQEDVLNTFKIFCSKKTVENILASTNMAETGPVSTGKRKFSEVNGENGEESSEGTQSSPVCEAKRSRSLTPSIRASIRSETGNIPKGYSKCSLCSYMSKFKANVTRHERGVHRINMEGSPVATVQYACAVCDYKSTYRSNVMRHEKSMHKLDSSTADLESRKIPMLPYEDDSSGHGMFTEGNQAVTSDGDQLFLNQTGSSDCGNFENQSFSTVDTDHEGQAREPVQFDAEAGKELIKTGADNDNNREEASKELAAGVSEDLDERDEVDFDEGCHMCNHCHEMFKTLSDLKEHIDATHFTVGNFSCEKCERSFKTEFSLQIHMSTHNASKQEVCGCGKAFQYRTSLIRHERKCEFRTSQETLKAGNEHDDTTNKTKENVSEIARCSESDTTDNGNVTEGVTEGTKEDKN